MAQLLAILNMVFLTLFKRINPQLKKINPNLSKKMRTRLFAYGHLFCIPHYYIEWEEFEKTNPFRVTTPLFRFSIGYAKIPFFREVSAAERAIRANPRTFFLTYNSTHSKRAHSKVFISERREALFKLINQAKLQGPKHNLISLYFNSQSSLATQAQIEEQLLQCLQKYQGEAKRERQEGSTRPKSVYQFLFPYDFRKNITPGQIKRFYQTTHGPIDSLAFNTILTHYYRLSTSLTRQDMRKDLRDFRLMLEKFDFIEAIIKIEKDNSKQSSSRCKRLIRILKWRTMQSEKYLVFLINEYGQGGLKKALELFEQAYKDYTAHSPIPVLP